MQLIHGHLHDWDAALPIISLAVDRLSLAKRRWRGTAADGAEFGFDLEHPLHQGDVFHETDAAFYQISQLPERVFKITLEGDAPSAARLGWLIGNLHFQLGIFETHVFVPADPALRQLFEREHIQFEEIEGIFLPLSGGHHH